ncbi:DUF3861 domain-containing protein [Quatrionicoccus australiensis]|uniref:DUF3861 domain-containing protein n=1 Tax=Quatrionicoccus australiensis TaxID=138118 RepID=UPI001CF8A0BE|nr:DUF3861 domain-containing protein [Quatrionicoccus australiensis]UCV13812.1 DUF3861 domain-containing protein [Quatrionicoccus australiensis]
MTTHRYRITVEQLDLAPQQGADSPATLAFEVTNHDDILGIVERFRQRKDFDDDSACALGVGLKLFSEVMLQNRTHPLFSEFRGHFGQFMKSLKSSFVAAAANS